MLVKYSAKLKKCLSIVKVSGIHCHLLNDVLSLSPLGNINLHEPTHF
jgi:hypothetical protein